MPADQPREPADSTDALIEACLQGDQSAWDAIVSRYRRKVFNVAYTFVGRHDEAEDLTQDIFLKVFKALRTFDRRANFTTWIISVSRNLCIDHYRRVRKEREVVDRRVDASELTPVAGGVDAFARLDRFDRRALLRDALSALPETLRTAVAMRDLQELSYQEIARRLDLPDGTVKSRINRGRHELARQVLRIEQARRAGSPERVGGAAATS
ncbi:MAG: RNA polymerase sigma factor [Acidobacteria bacterium]|nr:RNA polymerase sigma factor [Acidobacteriota bacterium]